MAKLDPLDKLRNKVIILSNVQHSPASQLELKFSFSPCPNLCMYQTNVSCNSSFAQASRIILWNFDTSLGQQQGQSRYPVLRVFVPYCACFVSRPLVKGNEDAAFEGPCLVIPKVHCSLKQRKRWAGKITDHYRLWNSEKSDGRACSQIPTIGIVLVIAFSVSKDRRIRYLWASGFWSFWS